MNCAAWPAAKCYTNGATAPFKPRPWFTKISISRMADATNVERRHRAHIFAIAAQMLRRILVAAARASSHSDKRQGGRARVDFDETGLAAPEPDRAIVALDDALYSLCRGALRARPKCSNSAISEAFRTTRSSRSSKSHRAPSGAIGTLPAPGWPASCLASKRCHDQESAMTPGILVRQIEELMSFRS